MLNTSQVAVLMGVTPATIERKTRAGFFATAIKNNAGHWEISTAEVLEALLQRV